MKVARFEWLLGRRCGAKGCKENHHLLLDLPLEVWWQMEDLAIAALPNETAGSLAGTIGRQKNWDHITVQHLIPEPIQSCGPDHCIVGPRRGRKANRRHDLASLLAGFQRRLPRIGSWHVHPVGGPELSTADREYMTTSSCNGKYWPLEIIAARDCDGDWYPCCHRLIRGEFREMDFVGVVDA